MRPRSISIIGSAEQEDQTGALVYQVVPFEYLASYRFCRLGRTIKQFLRVDQKVYMNGYQIQRRKLSLLTLIEAERALCSGSLLLSLGSLMLSFGSLALGLVPLIEGNASGTHAES
jgi:hypothetical protein